LGRGVGVGAAPMKTGVETMVSSPVAGRNISFIRRL